MKGFLYILIISITLFFMIGCSSYENDMNNVSNQLEIIDSGEYYRIYKENTNILSYDIYGLNGEIILSEKTERPLEINMLTDSIVDIKIGMGTGIAVHTYYNVKEDVFSRNFTYVISSSDDLIAYIDVQKEQPFKNRKIVIQNIFNVNLFYKEFLLDFSNIDTPVIDASFSEDNNSLRLIYLSGEEQKQISTVLNLT